MSKTRMEKHNAAIEKAERKLGKVMAELQAAKNAKEDRYCAVVLTMPRKLFERELAKFTGVESALLRSIENQLQEQ